MSHNNILLRYLINIRTGPSCLWYHKVYTEWFRKIMTLEDKWLGAWFSGEYAYKWQLKVWRNLKTWIINGKSSGGFQRLLTHKKCIVKMKRRPNVYRILILFRIFLFYSAVQICMPPRSASFFIVINKHINNNWHYVKWFFKMKFNLIQLM